MKLLHIDSSILSENSVSRQLSAQVVAQLSAGRDDIDIIYRDIAADPIPHLSGGYLAAQQSAEFGLTPDLQRDVAQGALLLDEFIAADIVVIGLGLYNFGMPSQLKAWVDRILVAGKTFRYTAQGVPEGLVPGKRIILAIARGGFYSEGLPTASLEHGESHLKTAFGFIGLDVEAIVAEGVAIGLDQRTAAIAAAQAQIGALVS